MCGRFVVARASADLAADLEVDRVSDEPVRESYNVAPTTRIPIVVEAAAPAEEVDEYGPEPIRRLELARWGLVPTWAKDESVGVRAFNARSETAATKPTFRASVKKRRGVIPADGYYEWQKLAGGTKQPYFIRPADGSLMLFAGLYEWWRAPDGEWLLSATILTRDSAPGPMAELHDRMPVFLDRTDVAEWLDPTVDGNADLILDFADRSATVAERLEHYPVDRRVGNVRENDAALIEPIEL
ncbi:SOS response-associated peptidase [Gulosibacter macacae]|uniref:Abasic site processing protein n=1 Tax=Gulosibacter macacae TaxID=2488791 RepID=A0A3P3W1Y4_9MICO|nr:SOS response-associated peptidase [Gulosibacter macacae]RRJ87896.1 SOS response-associated peptidase [Gulosibacter macacae]